jgi:hypothetical protein
VIGGVEPRTKDRMPDADKDEVQRQLLGALVAARRRAFRGPMALQLTLGTTGKAPSHAHHITKNLLDLFAAWRLPPAPEGGRGFVAVAVVADITGLGGVFSRIEDDIERWRDSLD